MKTFCFLIPVVMSSFMGISSVFALSEGVKSAGNSVKEEAVYVVDQAVGLSGEIDKRLGRLWEEAGLALPRKAADVVMVRRAYLDFLGRLPTVVEAREYADSQEADKYERLLEKLLNDDQFSDYWCMRWCDALRVKSEAPINLWPNAVYVYQRRIHAFLKNREPYDQFMRSLLLASGSNFRVPEANFYRAMAVRTPEGVAQAVMESVWGRGVDSFSREKQKAIVSFFDGISYKPTREWKEEIVFMKPSSEDRSLLRPDGRKVRVKAGEDARGAFCEYLFAEGSHEFAQATVNRVWFYFFHRELSPAGQKVSPARQKLLDGLATEFKKSGYDIRSLCRMIAGSAAYRASFISEEVDYTKAASHFAVYEPRRLEAEVLDDALADISGRKRSYVSVIPEPFSYIPGDRRTITLADGSLSSSFLILFGRSARDSGALSERNNTISTKQRQYLFNSGEIYKSLGGLSKANNQERAHFRERVEHLYWLFYARPPLKEELDLLEISLKKTTGKNKWRFYQDLCWILLNSKEFLHQH